MTTTKINFLKKSSDFFAINFDEFVSNNRVTSLDQVFLKS